MSKPNTEWLAVLLLVTVLLPSSYMGTYWSIVHKASFSMGGGNEYFPYYPYGGPIAQLIFKPAHYLDKKLRPEFWD